MATSMKCQAPDCDVIFESRRSAKYCSATCRSRARRAREAAAAEVESDKDAGTEKEHGLVKAVRRQLEKAKALDTVPGQLALQFARRMANPDEAGLSAMSKELRSLLAEAKSESTSAPEPSEAAGDAAAEDDDEVKKARRRREAIEAEAAAAAGAEAGA